MKYRGINYEPRRSKTNLTRGAFGKTKFEVKLVDVEAKFTPTPNKKTGLYKIDVSRLITSKYTPTSTTIPKKNRIVKKLDTQV